MAKLNFYPLGNADSTLIHLADDRLILKDYFKVDKDDEDDKRIDLERELRDYLDQQGRADIDVVAFSHADADHNNGADQFFWFDYAASYQGEDRIRMKELWVPACFILETGLSGSSKVIQREAKHRFKKGYGIRIFGNPSPLEQWLDALLIHQSRHDCDSVSGFRGDCLNLSSAALRWRWDPRERVIGAGKELNEAECLLHSRDVRRTGHVVHRHLVEELLDALDLARHHHLYGFILHPDVLTRATVVEVYLIDETRRIHIPVIDHGCDVLDPRIVEPVRDPLQTLDQFTLSRGICRVDVWVCFNP